MSMRRRHLVIFALLGLTTAVLLGREAGLRMVKYLDRLDEQIKNRQEDLRVLEIEVESQQTVVENWERIRIFADEPVVERQTNFSAYLQSLQAERNFNYMVMGPPVGRPFEGRTEYQILKYELSFYADLDDLIEFLARLDYSERLLQIERMKINLRQEYKRYPEDITSITSRIPAGNLSVVIAVSIPAALTDVDHQESEALR
ncbi:MAG: hypothetical protein JW709_11760 [Sedimentisphaerales bacterium]|nr:hypothetical protein [Sedimentisphaerales bacterium]